MSTIIELSQQTEAIFSQINENSSIEQIRDAETQLAKIWDIIKEKLEFAALVPIVSRARTELNSAIIFQGVANLEDNAKELKPLIGTISGIAKEAKEEAKSLRLEKLRGFLQAASEVEKAIKEAEKTINNDESTLADAGPKIQIAWNKLEDLIATLKAEKSELEA